MKPVNREILALVVPSIIANITTPLLGLVDTAITGHLGSGVYLAAIAVGSSMFNMLYWLFAFLRMGSSGMTAIATGRKDTRRQALVLYRGITVALIAASVMIMLSGPICDLMMRFMDADPETSALASRYFSIVIWGAPAVLSTYVLTGWFLGLQSSRRPMVISIAINIVNIAVSPALALGLGMKLDGVATGTLTAQWVGAGIGLIMCVRLRPERVTARDIFNIRALRRYFSINRDIMLRTLCLIAVTMWFTREGARQSETMLAVNALLMQLFILFSYIIDGFAFAGEAIVGRNIGAGDRHATVTCIKALLKWGALLALIYTVVYFIAGDNLLSMLTDDRTIRTATRDYLPWAVTVPLAGFMAFIWDGVYIGATATRGMLASMFVAMAIFFAVYFLLRPAMHNHALWLAFLTYLLVRGLMQTILWPRIKSKI